MSPNTFRRLVWKEYRLQRPLWIAIAVLAVLVELWVLLIHWYGGSADRVGFVTILYGTALVHTWFYAMGCGAVLFAGERENGTYDFQRALPVSPRQVFWAKLTFALLSTAVLLSVLVLLAAALAGWGLPPPMDSQGQWGVIAFACLEVLVWTIFFSLLAQGPLSAAILGVAAASILAGLLLKFTPGTFAPTTFALPQRVLLVAVVFLADCGLGYRWFRDATRRAFRWNLGTRWLTDRLPARRPRVSPSRGTMLARLTWQHWRQSGWMLAGIGVTCVLAIAITLMLEYEYKTGVSTGPAAALRSMMGFAASTKFWFVVGAVAPVLLGVFAFRADQQDASFRFLTDRGVSPRLVWLSRQLTWVGIVAVGALVLLLAVGLAMPLPDPSERRWPPVVEEGLFQGFCATGRVLALVSLGCALGQFCSMLLASGILAIVLAAVLGLVAALWIATISFFQMNWLWAVAPFPLVMLLATWLRAPDWMAQRNRVRHWLLPGVTLVVPTLGVLAAVALVRAYEVPTSNLGFSPEEYAQPASPEAAKTAQMYLRALDLVAPRDLAEAQASSSVSSIAPKKQSLAEIQRHLAARLKENREALELTLESTRRPACDFLARSESLVDRATLSDSNRPRLEGLGGLLTMKAQWLENEGKLDEALEFWVAKLRFSAHLRQRSGLFASADWDEGESLGGLLQWAIQPGQTSPRVLGALRRLEQFLAQLPSPYGPIQWQYWYAKQRLQANVPEPGKPTAMFWLRSLPWERERSRRALDFLMARRSWDLVGVKGAIGVGGNPRLETLWSDARLPPMSRWAPPFVHNTFLGDWMSWSYSPYQYASQETVRRVTRILLAIQAWRLDHGGQFPQSLDLLKEKYLGQIPLDPCAGEPFHYYPQGWPIGLHQTLRFVSSWVMQGDIAPNTPFLWGVGMDIGVQWTHRPGEDDLNRFAIYWFDDTFGRPNTRQPRDENDLLIHGWAFSLPAASR